MINRHPDHKALTSYYYNMIAHRPPKQKIVQLEIDEVNKLSTFYKNKHKALSLYPGPNLFRRSVQKYFQYNAHEITYEQKRQYLQEIKLQEELKKQQESVE
ncbi:Hypothetical_protein [Hexamita inflata]|uniref:Hypothetical_protein n=1 Tax=Hexamita inflata TaxID=28002 RepID=A0AA86UBN9_9EUKA|nr:Hypothetical protein HINF_LOCUS23538 [Hexamita inflata]